MLATLNLFLAAILLCAGVLAARGFMPHLDFWGRSAAGYLARGLAICALSAFPRLFVWDVAWRINADLVMRVGPGPINMVVNLILLLGLWHILKARHLTIPEPHRGRYSIFTAPFYPGCVFTKARWRRK